MRGYREIWVGGKDAEVVEVVGGATVVSVGILELAEIVQSVDLLQGYLKSVWVNIR